MCGRLRRRVVATAPVLLLAAAACSGDGDAGSLSGTDGGVPATGERSEVRAPEAPAPPSAGTGVLVLGEQRTFEVTSCRLEPDEREPAGARTLLAASGAGTAASGEFTVEVRRFVTGTDVVTYTDTITYEDGARILQAQRVEVAGQVTDLRAPEAASPLIRPRDDGLSVSGIAGPPGGSPEQAEGNVGIALNLTCT